MVEIEDIDNSVLLRDWLDQLSQARQLELSPVIASRAALRCLPLLWEWMLEEAPRRPDLSILPFSRCLLISAVGTKKLNSNIGRAGLEAKSAASLSSAARDDVSTIDAAYASAHAILRSVVVSKASEINDALKSAYFTVGSLDAVANAVDSVPAVWASIRSDCSRLYKGRDIENLPLWSVADSSWSESWDRVKRKAIVPEWAFWIRWYDDVLAGNPMNWELLEQIALIPNEVWDQGPSTVSKHIELITRRISLRDEAQRLKVLIKEMALQQATIHQRSHNRPPSLVETETNLQYSLTLIWGAMEQAERELEKTAPDPSFLRRLANRILTASHAVATYCASVAGAVVNNAAAEFGKGMGKWGSAAIIAAYAAQTEPARSFAKSLKDLAEIILNINPN